MTIENYANEKLSIAVGVLCTHPGKIKERVEEVLNRSLIAVTADHFTEVDLQDWNYIKGNADNADEATYVEIANKILALSCKYD